MGGFKKKPKKKKSAAAVDSTSSYSLGQTLRLLFHTDSSVKATFRRQTEISMRTAAVYLLQNKKTHRRAKNLAHLIIYLALTFILTQAFLGFQLFQPLG